MILNLEDLHEVGKQSLARWPPCLEDNSLVVDLKQGGEPLACLAGNLHSGGVVLIPIVLGVVYVGRSPHSDVIPEHLRSLAGVLEGTQWRFETTYDGKSEVADDSSTGGSVLLRKDVRREAAIGLGKLIGSGIGELLGWNGKVRQPEPIEITDGDTVVNQYRAFVYCKYP